MKSTIHTIKNKLYDLNPDIPPEHIDEILTDYFNHIKTLTFKLNKSEISLLWGTLVVKKNRLKSKIRHLNSIKEEFLQTKDRALYRQFYYLLYRGSYRDVANIIEAKSEEEIVSDIDNLIERLTKILNERYQYKKVTKDIPKSD